MTKSYKHFFADAAMSSSAKTFNKTLEHKVCLPAKSKPVNVAIDGNIAAGKSTLIDALKVAIPEWNIVQEPVKKWTNFNGAMFNKTKQDGGNLLKMFLDDKYRWSHTFQSYALFSKLRLYSNQLNMSCENRCQVNIFERSYYSDRYIFAENCFEKGFMGETEWNIYKEWCEYLVESIGGYNLDGLIYLRTSPKVCVSRTFKRGRPEEKDILLEYVEPLHEKHENLFHHKTKPVNDAFHKLPVLVLDYDDDMAAPKIMKRNILAVQQFACNLSREKHGLRSDISHTDHLILSPETCEEVESESDMSV